MVRSRVYREQDEVTGRRLGVAYLMYFLLSLAGSKEKPRKLTPKTARKDRKTKRDSVDISFDLLLNYLL